MSSSEKNMGRSSQLKVSAAEQAVVDQIEPLLTQKVIDDITREKIIELRELLNAKIDRRFRGRIESILNYEAHNDLFARIQERIESPKKEAGPKAKRRSNRTSDVKIKENGGHFISW